MDNFTRGVRKGVALVVAGVIACVDGPAKPPAIELGIRSVSINAAPTNGGATSGGGSWQLAVGPTVTVPLTASPNPGYDFDRWAENGTTLSTDSVFQMEITGEHEITAHFSVNPVRGGWGPANTYTDYSFPDSGYESLAWTFVPAVDPPETLREKDLLHYYAYTFELQNSSPEVGFGYTGFQSDGHFRVGSRRRLGKVVNFSIWGSDDARTAGRVDRRNPECGCYQIMYPYDWVEGRAYRFELRAGPGGAGYRSKWWGLWVTDLETDSVTFIGEQRMPTSIEGRESRMLSPGTSAFGEDLHWWLSRDGTESFVCGDFEPSSLAVVDVTAGPERIRPHEVSSSTSSGRTDVAENGYTTTLCHVTVFTEDNGDVQYNIGFWPEPPERVIGN